MQDFVHQQYQLHLHFIHSSAWPFLQRTKLRANRSCLRTDREGSVKTVGASKGEDERPVIYYHHHHWQQQQQQQQLSSPVQSRFQQLWVQLPTANSEGGATLHMMWRKEAMYSATYAWRITARRLLRKHTTLKFSGFQGMPKTNPRTEMGVDSWSLTARPWKLHSERKAVLEPLSTLKFQSNLQAFRTLFQSSVMIVDDRTEGGFLASIWKELGNNGHHPELHSTKKIRESLLEINWKAETSSNYHHDSI